MSHSIKTVWVLIRPIDYSMADVIGVFDSFEKASEAKEIEIQTDEYNCDYLIEKSEIE